jgi:hypothetical protein
MGEYIVVGTGVTLRKRLRDVGVTLHYALQRRISDVKVKLEPVASFPSYPLARILRDFHNTSNMILKTQNP